MKLIQLLILLLFATGAFAQSFAPEHFDYNITVDVDGNSNVHSLFLPAHIYQNTRKPFLADMQVFNSLGETVPFAVVDVAPYTYEAVPPKPILFFPLYTEVVADDNTTSTVLDELIIDLRNDVSLPAKLRIDFTGEKNFNTVVSIYSSNGDLNEWVHHTTGTLAHLTNSTGESILQNELFLPILPVDTQYIKLSGAIQPSTTNTSYSDVLSAIVRINALYHDKPIYKTDYEYITVNGTPDEDSENAIVFDLQGFYPISGVELNIQT
jgi:hypothetical protein